MNPLATSLLLTLLSAAPPTEQVSGRWLRQCAEELPATPPTFSASEVDALLRGEQPLPSGWEVHSLPATMTARTCWFVARAAPAQGETGIWVGPLRAAATVWLDGEVVWRKGREEGPHWRGDQGFNGFALTGSQLAAEAPRLLAIRTYSKIEQTQLRDLRYAEPLRFPELQERDVNLSLRLVTFVMWFLIALSLGGLIFFTSRRDRRILYFSIGVGGFSQLFIPITPEHLSLDHGWLVRLSLIGVVAAYPFFALFFQHLYGIHQRPLHDRLAAGALAVTAVLALLLPERLVLPAFSAGTLISFLALFYGLYLNVRARREGNRIARSVLWGFGAYFAAVFYDGARYFVGGSGNEFHAPLYHLGVLAFVISILVAITRRFLELSVESSTMLAQLQGAAKELGGLVTHLQTASTQLSSATAEQVTALTETASTTTEMNQTSALSASRAAELIQQGEAVTTVVADGKSAAESSRTAIQEISSSLSTVSSASGELAERVQRIDRIIDTVSFLADQSAALAINASIEASRAGEAGQGFAAVAREVRSLANDSRRATAEVREVLDEIRNRTLQVESQVTQGARIVAGGVQQVSRLAQVVDLLGGTIQNSVGLMRQVEASARQHQAGVEQVLQAVTNIQRASESIRDGAETLSTLSRQANALSGDLVAASPRATPSKGTVLADG